MMMSCSSVHMILCSDVIQSTLVEHLLWSTLLAGKCWAFLKKIGTLGPHVLG